VGLQKGGGAGSRGPLMHETTSMLCVEFMGPILSLPFDLNLRSIGTPKPNSRINLECKQTMLGCSCTQLVRRPDARDYHNPAWVSNAGCQLGREAQSACHPVDDTHMHDSYMLFECALTLPGFSCTQLVPLLDARDHHNPVHGFAERGGS
jgi:hypothetical protein